MFQCYPQEASGDDGSGDQIDDGNGHVDFPACSPFALGVGGTMLTKSGATVKEVVWWDSPGRRTNNGGGASGGGVSTKFARPAWQTVKVTSINRGSIDGRVVPDVSALAGEPLYSLTFAGKAQPNGGTSASAPLWAALLAKSMATFRRGSSNGSLLRCSTKLRRRGNLSGKLLRATLHPATIRRIPNPVRAIKRERNEASVRFDSNLGPLSTRYPERAPLTCVRGSVDPVCYRAATARGAVSQLRWGTIENVVVSPEVFTRKGRSQPLQKYFRRPHLIETTSFNQTNSLYHRHFPTRFFRTRPRILSNRERSFAGRSPAVISWPGNVELR